MPGTSALITPDHITGLSGLLVMVLARAREAIWALALISPALG